MCCLGSLSWVWETAFSCQLWNIDGSTLWPSLASVLPLFSSALYWQWQPTPVLSPGKSQDGGAWWAAVHGVAKSRTWLSNFTFTFHFHALEKEMAAHSSVLAWRIPGTGSHRVGHDWSDSAAVAVLTVYQPGVCRVKTFFSCCIPWLLCCLALELGK